MYLRAAKTEAEDSGESVDGMANSVSELRDEILSLTGGKVDIQIDDETFKSSYQIMKELSGVWDELSDISQANLLESIAGKRNANAVTALIENFEIAERVMGTLETSSGSALKENQKYLDSIEGRIQKFQATFESLSTSIANSKAIKIAVSGATELLSILDELTQTLGGLPVIITGITTAMSIGGFGVFDFKVGTDGDIVDDGLLNSIKNYFEKYKTLTSEIDKYNSLVGKLDIELLGSKQGKQNEQVISRMKAQIEDCISTTEKYDHSMAEIMRKYKQTGQSGEEYVKSLKNVAAQTIKAKAETIAMNLAFSLVTSAVVSLLVYLGTQLYDALVVTSEEMENCSAGATALAESLSENEKWISSIEELRSKLSDENLSLSEQQSLKESLLSIQDAIIEKYGDEAGAIDLVNGKYAEMIDYLNEVSEKEFNTWRTNNRDAIDKSVEKYTGGSYWQTVGENTLKEWTSFLTNESEENAGLLRNLFNFNPTPAGLSIFTSSYDDLEKYSSDLTALYATISKLNGDNRYDRLLSMISKFSSKASNDIVKYGDTYERYMQDVISTNKALSVSYDSVESASESFNQSLVGGSPEEVASAYQTLETAVDTFLASIGQNVGENAESIAAYYENSFDEVLETAKANVVMVDLKANDSQLRQDVETAIESMGRTGYFSASEIKSGLETGSISKYTDAFMLFTKLSEKLGTSLSGVVDILVDLGYFGGEVAVEVSDGIQDTIDSYTTMANLLAEVRDEQEKHGSVSVETYRKLAAMGEDYADVLELQEGKYVFSAEAAQKLLDEQFELAYETLVAANATDDQVAALQAFYTVLSGFRTQMGTYVDKIQDLNEVQEKVAEGTQFTKDEVDELLEAYPELSFVLDESTGHWDLQAESLETVRTEIEKLIQSVIEFEKKLTALQQQSILEDAGWSTGAALQSAISRFVNESGATSVEEYADYYGLDIADLPEHTKKIIELEIQLSGAVEGYEKMISGDVPTTGFGTSSSSSSKSTKDAWKEAFEKQYQELQHQRTMEQITEEQYINGVEALYKEYFSNLSKYREEYYKYEEEVYSGRQALIDEYIQDLEKEYDYSGDEKKVIEELNALLADRADILSKDQKETINTKLLEYEEQIYRRQIDALEEQVDILDDKEGSEEETINCYKSMINLLYDIKSIYKDIYSEDSELMVSLESEITDLTSKITKIKKELWEAQRDAQVEAFEDEQDAIEDYQDAIEDLLDATVDLIKRETEAEIEALEDAQEAREEWYDNEIDRIEEVADARREALEDELEGYRKIIEAKKEALQDEADEEDYNAEVASRAKEISDLQSKIDILSLDDSKSAMAERLELEEELAEKKTELAKYQRDYALDNQLEALDDELDAFEDYQNEKIDKIEEEADAQKEYLENQKDAVSKSYDEQIDLLREHLNKEGVLWEEANARLLAEGNTLFAQLRSYAAEYTTDVEGLEEAWQKVLQAVNAYNGGTLDLSATSDSMDRVYESNTSKIDSLKNMTYTDVENSPESVAEKSLISQYKALMQTSSAAWKDANAAGSTSEMAYWANRNQELAAELNEKLGREALTYDKWKGIWYLDGVRFYHKGGVAGDVGSLQQDELLAVLKKREMVLTEPMQDTLAKYIQFAKTASFSLTSLLADDPIQNIVSRLQKQGTVVSGRSDSIHVEKLFDFHADAITKESLPETEEMLKRAADYTVRKLEDRLSRRGVKTKVSGV